MCATIITAEGVHPFLRTLRASEISITINFFHHANHGHVLKSMGVGTMVTLLCFIFFVKDDLTWASKPDGETLIIYLALRVSLQLIEHYDTGLIF